MKHDELLKKVKLTGDSSLESVIYAVVNLHKSGPLQLAPDTEVCPACWGIAPCETIKLIEEQLK